jgi:UDP-N-acetylmuramate dehydrogenase
MLFRENIILAPYTTFGIGGPARWFAEASTEAEVAEGVAFAQERGLPLFTLGGGSNLLVSDKGFPGLVLRIGLRGITLRDGIFEVGAGENWDSFVTLAVEHGFSGIECLAGIPGTVGGTPVQNVGAYGQEVAATISRVKVFDLTKLQPAELSADQCGFYYRHSIFNSTARGQYIVTGVIYALQKDGAASVAYADLKRYFQDWKTVPTLLEVSRAVREIRHGKGMLIVEGDPDCRSAGSFFKNPVVSQAHYERIAADSGGVTPKYPAGDGQVKIPAAWLLDKAGFHKGYVLGAAGISSRHTLALINRGGASAEDVLALSRQIVMKVEVQFGIHLEPEPVLVT